MSEPRTATDDEIGLLAYQVWSYKQGEMVSLLIHLGDRLGPLPGDGGAGPVSSQELADRTGLHERWVRGVAAGTGRRRPARVGTTTIGSS